MGLLSRVENGAAGLVLKKADNNRNDSGMDPTKEKIIEYHRTTGNFNCILLDIPGYAEDEANFLKKISKIINKTGTVIPLATGCPLIMLPLSADRELIAHRLSKSLDAKTLLSFEAESPENVISRINSLSENEQ